MMTLTISFPDEILAGNNGDLAHIVLEQVALIGFKSRQLTTAQVRRLLGFESRLQVHEFLAAHGVPWVDCDEEDLQHELETLKKLAP
jgi:Uncharacterised protein family (UPF0175)